MNDTESRTGKDCLFCRWIREAEFGVSSTAKDATRVGQMVESLSS